MNGYQLRVIVLLLWLAPAIATAQRASFEKEPINYQTAPVSDPVAKLIERLKANESKLEFDQQHGYLKSILKELEVPISSQVLVFSKTSLQVHKITPERPRAIYFNDDVYVGWCQGGDVIELGSTDPTQGAIFYAIKQEPQSRPEILRDQGQCIVCHASSRTQDVPGYLVRSVYPNRAGHPEFARGTYLTDQTSPFEKRWGGWYVTGTHGDMKHMGNTIFDDPTKDTLESGANRKSLAGLVSTKPYLSEHSDLVALMVLEHQTQMHNAITYANFETRRALHQSETMNEILDRAPGFVSESAERRIESAAERVVEQLLMCDEFQLTSAVQGTSGYAQQFEAAGRRDGQGRSLRQLDLQTRLFRYPCSYLIYSDSFAGLPDEVRTRVVAKLVEILGGRKSSDKYAHLAAEDRKAILEILRQTHPDFQ